MLRRRTKTCSLIVLAAFMLACLPSIPLSADIPTTDPNLVFTAIILTADVAATRTAANVPPTGTVTHTSMPTATPTETVSPTPTFIFVLPTATVPSATPFPGSTGNQYDCQVLSKSPDDNAHFNPATNFTMNWQVINMGTDTWDENSADFRYQGGAVLHKTAIYDLQKSLGTGETMDFTIPMKAPGSAGTYSTTWVIRIGPVEFCEMSLTILVP